MPRPPRTEHLNRSLIARFADEYAVDLDPIASAGRLGLDDPERVGRRLMARPEVQDAITRTMDRRASRVQVQQDYVLRRLLTIERADPLKIQRWVFDPCRYCWGLDHRFQFTDHELVLAVDAYRKSYDAGQHDLRRRTSRNALVDEQLDRAWDLGRKGLDLPPFDDLGGNGFTLFKQPCRGQDFVDWERAKARELGWSVPVYTVTNAHTCPVCWGYGEKRWFVRDVENLEVPERLLVKGFKSTPTGIELQLRDQEHVRELIAKHLGMFVERHAVVLADVRNLSDAELDAQLTKLGPLLDLQAREGGYPFSLPAPAGAEPAEDGEG